MGVISLSPSTQLFLGAGKKSRYARVISCDRYVASSGKGSEIATMFLDEKKGHLLVWREKKGITKLGGAGKYATRVVDTACDGFFTAVFFHHDNGKRLGLAVLQRSPLNPATLIDDPVDYSVALDGVLMPLLSHKSEEKNIASLLRIHRTSLKQTASDLVVGAVIVVRGGEAYLVIGAFAANLWKLYRLDTTFGMPACMRVHSDRIVSVWSCAVGPPVDHTIAAKAPTVEMALSVFEQTRVHDGNDDKVECGPPRLIGTSCCVVFCESIFSLDDRDPTIRVCYQSRLFSLPHEAESAPAAHLCHMYADKEQQRYAVFLSFAAQSYIVHLRRSPFDMELMTHCSKFGLRGVPFGVAWLTLPHPSRPDGGLQAILAVSQDYHLHAAEVFGNVIDVKLSDGSNTVRFGILSSKSGLRGDFVLEGPANLMHLFRIGENEVLCSNGFWAVVLQVTTDLAVDGDAPRELFVPFTIDSEDSERRFATLVKALLYVEELSKLNRSELLKLLFKRLLPMLHCAGSSQQEMFLIQRVFQALLIAVAPRSAADWRIMWSFATLLQKKLSRQDWDNSVVYTDMFFVYLVENYVHSHGSVDERRLAEEAFVNVVSDELKQAWTKFTQQQDDDALFLLDSLAERLSPIAVAEECVRRMIVVSTLSNGVHVVYAIGRTFHVVHAVGTVLLASCLQVPLYVNTDEAGQLVCCTTSAGETSVFVPPTLFKNSSAFEYALTLSTDLLCTMAPDTSLMPCAAALLSMLVAKRYHVVSAFLNVFAFPFSEYMALLQPLCDNVSLITGCSRAVFLSEAALFESILSQPTQSDILFVLSNGSMVNDYFNTPLWRHVGSFFDQNTQSLIIAAVLHAMTDRLIAAQSNYSTSIVKAFLKEGVEKPLQQASVEVFRRRLEAVLTRLEHLWASVGAWLPYRVNVIADAVLLFSTALHDRKDEKEQALLGSSAVFRTYVICFRIMALVGYSHRLEKTILELMEQVSGDISVVVRLVFLLIQAIENLKGTALPTEYFQWRCVDVAMLSESMCAGAYGLAGFLLEMLQLSGASRTATAPLKQYYYAVVDRLRTAAHADENNCGGGASGSVAFDELRSQLVSNSKELVAAKAAATNTVTTFFCCSKAGGANVPEWPGDHSLPTRRYLITTEWMDVLWPIEFVPHLLESSLTCALERVCGCDTNTDVLPEVDPSPYFLQALFFQLRTLSPPVNRHAAMLAATEKVDAVEKVYSLDSQEPLHVLESCIASRAVAAESSHFSASSRAPEAKPGASAPVPPALSASRSHRRIPSSPRRLLPLNNADGVVDGALTTNLTPASHKRDESSLVFFSTDEAHAAADAAMAPLLYPPESVAWWETNDVHSSVFRERHVSGEVSKPVVSSESTDTATSYTTTMTTDACVHSFYRDKRTISSSCVSPHQCKMHARRHYRCAKHRIQGTYTNENGVTAARSYSCAEGTKARSLRRELLFALGKKKEKPTEKVAFLQLHSVLKPPPLPISNSPESTKQLLRAPVHPEKGDSTPPQLLSLQTKPYVSRVKLFAWSEVNKKAGQDEGSNSKNFAAVTVYPPLSLARPASPLRPLVAPPLPPSCVFAEAPPLRPMADLAAPAASCCRSALHILKVGAPQQEDFRARDDEELFAPVAASFFGALETAPAPVTRASTVSQHVAVGVTTPEPCFLATSGDLPPPSPPKTSVQLVCQEGRANLLLDRAATDLQPRVEKSLVKDCESTHFSCTLPPTPQPIVTNLERSPLSMSAVDKPILSPSQTADFHRYVEKLKAFESAVPLFLEPNLVRQDASADKSYSDSVVGGVGLQAFDAQQEHKILTIVKELLSQHEERQTKLFNDVMEELRSKEQRHTFVPSNAQAIPQSQGLSGMEQAMLVRHTIQQKDKLLMMNQELLELQAQAQRLASTAASEQGRQFTAFSPALTEGASKHGSVSAVGGLSVCTGLGTVLTEPEKKIALSSGVQIGPGMIKQEDASTMAVQPTLPPTLLTSQEEQQKTEEQKQETFQVVNNSTGLAKHTVTDVTSAISIDNTMASLKQINSDLLRVNATTEDMGRAIQESRDIMSKHALLGTAHMSSVEGSLMMDAVRRRTAELEQQLTALNCASAKPLFGGVQHCVVAEQGSEAPESLGVSRPLVYQSPTFEGDRNRGIKDATAMKAVLMPQHKFTTEYVEAQDDSAQGFCLSAMPPSPFDKQERGAEHTFHSQVDEALQGSFVHFKGDDTLGVAPTAQVSRLPATSFKGGSVEAELQHCSRSLSIGKATIDLGQLYMAAQGPTRKRASLRRGVSPAKRSARASPSPSSQSVPKRFAMYAPAAAPKGTRRRAGGNSRTGSCFSESPQHPTAAKHEAKTGKAVATAGVIVPECRSRKLQASGRDRIRLEMLARNTSKRLAELQRAFI